MTTDSSPADENVFAAILINPLESLTVRKLSQPENTDSPSEMTLSVIQADFRPSQDLNAYEPMLVTPFGMLTDVKAEPENAPSPIVVRLVGKVIDLSDLQP